MIKKLILSAILLALAWAFSASPEFKEIAAGVAIFLFGMLSLEEGFKAFTGGVLENLLDRSTDRLWKSLGFGMLVTTVMQSSSLVSVIAISFLSAGLIELAPGLGIIFGANIGTTTGAWLVAGIGLNVDIAAYALPMIVFGVILLFQSQKALKGLGYILAGVGFLFLGIAYMKAGFESFQSGIDLARYAVPGLKGLLIYALVGILATVVMQSSHATLILAIAALAAGQITYENSLAIAIGSNVGTTVTAVLGAMGANTAGKRLALAHFIFNLTTGLIAIVFISPLAFAVDEISAVLGIAADDYPLKFAVFHSLFNVIGVAIMAPLIPRLVPLLERLVPARELGVSQPHFLNEAALAFPDTALKAIVREAGHLFQNAYGFIAAGLGLSEDELRSGRPPTQIMRRLPALDAAALDDLYERRIKGLHGAIFAYSTRAEAGMLPAQLALLMAIRRALRDVVTAIKDIKHLHKNLLRYGAARNPDMRAQYAAAQSLIAAVLQANDLIPQDRDRALAALEAAEREIAGYDIVENGTLDGLIRDNRITPAMATSLINDSGYAINIARKLAEAGRTLLEENTYALLLSVRAEDGTVDATTAVQEAA